MSAHEAPGGPGLPPRWTDARKTGVGTSAGSKSKVWFTIGQGIVNEVYYPRVDRAGIRDMGLVVTGPSGFFSEEKRDSRHGQCSLVDGVPLYRLTNECSEGRYRMDKTIFADPNGNSLVQRTRFAPLVGDLTDYHLVVLLAPRLGNKGAGNTGWVGDYKGEPVVFAERDGSALALACSAPWSSRTVGFVGSSDAWQDLIANGEITHRYDRAADGNVGLAGEVDLPACDGEFVVVVGFGRTPEEAGHHAIATLRSDVEALQAQYVDEWRAWHDRFGAPGRFADAELYRTSLTVLKTHEGKDFDGALIASLSIPWGAERGDDASGGYHLVWPRDLVLGAGALLAARDPDGVRPVLEHLKATQDSNGGWPQNMWLDGAPHWTGVQLDEVALPILLVDLARRFDGGDDATAGYFEMVRSAAGFLVRHGPVTPQDRWEENSGYSPFTLATTVAALLAAADFLEGAEPDVARYLRETADAWNESIERWTYAGGTELAREVGVDGYYVRIAPAGAPPGGSPVDGMVQVANRPFGSDPEPARDIVSPDALALVRFGLRAPDDPRIRNTVRVIDALLEVDTPAGSGYYRYNGDGYGEHDDGRPFDGTGRGRLWPLLSAERAHYELAAGNPERAGQLAAAVARFANEGGMLPEQVWDSPPVPEHGLYPGRGTGSATPLVWAHGEYIKLIRSLEDGAVFDVPPQTVQRYQVDGVRSGHAIWRDTDPIDGMAPGATLRVESTTPCRVRWTSDDWRTESSVDSSDTGLGIHHADLPTARLRAGVKVAFLVEREGHDEAGPGPHIISIEVEA